MIYVIAPPAVQRDKPIRKAVIRAGVFFTAALAAGLLLGGVLGAAGAALPSTARVALAAVAALLLATVGAFELFERHVPLPQLSRETSRRYGALGLSWVARNGVAMGIGITTRLGFWLWYALPLAAALSGGPLRGAVVFGSYALVRASAPIAIIVARLADWRLIALPWRRHAQRFASSLSILVAWGFIVGH